MSEEQKKQSRPSTEVLIDGHVYSLMGADSVYLQEVAAWVNAKLAEVKRLPGYRKMDDEYKNLLLNLNLADDYFREKDEAQRCRKETEALEKELYGVKHDMVSTKMKLEAALKQQEIIEKRCAEWKQKYEDAIKQESDESGKAV